MKETTTGRWLTERGAFVVLVLGMFASIWLSRIIDGRLVVAGGTPRGFDPLAAVRAQTLSQ